MGLDATVEQKLMWQDQFRIFRHGHGQGFGRFNDGDCTQWTTRAEKIADAGKANAGILGRIKTLDKSHGNDTEETELKRQLTEIGFCNPVGSKDLLSITMPSVGAQLEVNRLFNSQNAITYD